MYHIKWSGFGFLISFLISVIFPATPPSRSWLVLPALNCRLNDTNHQISIQFLLLTNTRIPSPVPACLFCRLISSLDFASRFSHFLLQSETVRWICGKAVLMAWAISSQACLLSWIDIPVLHFPLIMFFFSCINCARRRHSWSVQLGLLFLVDIPSISCRGMSLKDWLDDCFRLSVSAWLQLMLLLKTGR